VVSNKNIIRIYVLCQVWVSYFMIWGYWWSLIWDSCEIRVMLVWYNSRSNKPGKILAQTAIPDFIKDWLEVWGWIMWTEDIFLLCVYYDLSALCLLYPRCAKTMQKRERRKFILMWDTVKRADSDRRISTCLCCLGKKRICNFEITLA
jgi:hypothetical protein